MYDNNFPSIPNDVGMSRSGNLVAYTEDVKVIGVRSDVAVATAIATIVNHALRFLFPMSTAIYFGVYLHLLFVKLAGTSSM